MHLNRNLNDIYLINADDIDKKQRTLYLLAIQEKKWIS